MQVGLFVRKVKVIRAMTDEFPFMLMAWRIFTSDIVRVGRFFIQEMLLCLLESTVISMVILVKL